MVCYQVVLDKIAMDLLKERSVQLYSDALTVVEEMYKEDRLLASAYCRYFVESAKIHAALLAADCGDDTRDVEKMLSIVECMLAVDADTDFDHYMQLMEWHRKPDKRFYQPRRHVLLPVVQDLQDLYDGKLDFYSLSTPPRVGKSTIGCFFMSFNMGSHPLDAHIMTGFSDKLTSSFYVEMLSLVSDSDEYCFTSIFPEANLASCNAANEAISLCKSRRFPTLTCRSIGGTLTGAVEVGKKGILYCDDMVEDYEQALNADRMDKLYEAYLSQARDRKLDGAKEFHIGTRWVPNDIIGRIEQEFAGNPRYRFRRIPALNEDGESNFVYQFDLGFSTEYYLDMRRLLINAGAEDNWCAKYMAMPYWKEGRLYESGDLRMYESLPDGEPDIILAVCDTKTKGPDYCVQVVDKVYGDDHYIDAVICDDGLMESIEPRLVDQLVDQKVSVARYESNVAGGKISRDVEGKCHARGSAIVMRPKYSTENKETRILADSGWVKQRCLFLCDCSRGSEYDRFMTQLLSYNAKSKNKHDDVPDAMSMLRRFVDATIKAHVTAFKRPW